MAAFLRGLFDADGCVRLDNTKGSYVGLASTSRELLVDVQRLLSTFGIAGTIWDGRPARKPGPTNRRADGTEASYQGSATYDLRITSMGMLTFAQEIGFSLPSKASKLEQVLAGRPGVQQERRLHEAARHSRGRLRVDLQLKRTS